jgi:altronate dehydratase large subunit
VTQATLKGYRRNGNSVGIRNHIVVVSSIACANSILERIAESDREVVPITHQHGCALHGADREQILRTLSGTCANPNVGGVLLVGLGCEGISVNDIASRIPADNRIVKSIVIQEIGSVARIMESALASLREMKEFVRRQSREDLDISSLIVGLECGGSDPFSGITANPAVGLVSDRLVSLGATVLLSEVPEMVGAEAALEARIADDTVRKKLFSRIAGYVRTARNMGCDPGGANLSPGNIKAGLSSAEEKSLGCIAKGGHSEIRDFVAYAETPKGKGLVVMDTPGYDAESVTGMVAGGASVILFTTGVGTPLGNPVAPVIKISSNTKTFEKMGEFTDINAGKIVEGAKTGAVADEIFEFLVEVCNGRKTASEANNCKEFAINRIGATF